MSVLEMIESAALVKMFVAGYLSGGFVAAVIAWFCHRPYERAIAKILREEGLVCDEFVDCRHRACMSSCAAYLIADAARAGDVLPLGADRKDKMRMWRASE